VRAKVRKISKIFTNLLINGTKIGSQKQNSSADLDFEKIITKLFGGNQMSISLERGREIFKEAPKELRKVFVGYDDLITCIFLCLISKGRNTTGNLLLEGETGVGKSTIFKLIAPMFGLEYSRIQGHGDLTPSDITGYLDARTREIIKGPIFAHIVHADEFNRIVPGSRSAFLDAMAERLVTIHTTTFVLEPPFIVIAAVNPDSYGDTSPFRMQERDRFPLSFYSDWPTPKEQIEIIRMNTRSSNFDAELPQLSTREEILELQEKVARSIYVDDSIDILAMRIARQLLPEESDIEDVKGKEIIKGASIIRGANDLVINARSFAFLEGDSFVTPEHIGWVADFVFPHRIDAYAPDFFRNDRIELTREAVKKANDKMMFQRV